MKIDFPQKPDGTLPELWRACLDLLPQIENRVRTGIAIGTTETPVAHGLGFAPLMGVPVPRSEATIWRTRSPDSKYMYFAPSQACTADVLVVP